MIRSLLFGALLLFPSFCAKALDESPAAIAEREAAEEREKRANARLEDMEKTIIGCEKRISVLNEDIRSLREEVGKLREGNNDSQTREGIKRLKEAIEEVDKKRMEDNKKVVAALEELQGFIKKNLSAGGSVRPSGNSSPAVKPNHSSPRKDTENGYEYTIVDKDTLSGIIAKLRSKNIRVTQKQMMDANPEVKWTNLQIGQKIFVPAP